MIDSIFSVGTVVTIPMVLKTRDERVTFQQKYVQQYPTNTLVAIKMNIPGPIKNNSALCQLFNEGITRFKRLLQQEKINNEQVLSWQRKTGNELFLNLSCSILKAKQTAIQFEDLTLLGRIFDIDVFGNGNSTAISRTTLALPVRRCFICDRPAKECSRSRQHSVLELQNFVNNLYQQVFKEVAYFDDIK